MKRTGSLRGRLALRTLRSVGVAVWRLGVVYALPRTGFRREWGHEWVNPEPVRLVLRVPVGPEDFPLRDAVVGLSGPEEFRRVSHHLRAAKCERGPTPVV